MKKWARQNVLLWMRHGRKITGQDEYGNEVFALRGVKFENVTYSIKDDAGKTIAADKTREQLMEARIATL